jgi:beta-fructofuranosidase
MLRRPDPTRPVGDPIPYYDERTHTYHLFYLSPLRDADSLDERLAGVRWDHVSSTDLRSWVRHPPAIVPGPAGSYDHGGALTGSIIRHNETFHLFYVGHEPGSSLPQTICHATSADLIHFDKDARNPVLVPEQRHFEASDWRDPFVLWNSERREFWMLVSARMRSGPAARSGCVALATSPDLAHWDVRAEPLVAPQSTLVPECAELLHLGGEWILGYSAYTGRPGLHYLSAPTIAGPWRAAPSLIEGATWYAGRSLIDGDGRALSFAWLADKVGRLDAGRVLWGGDLSIPRELYRAADGTLCHRIPKEVLGAFARPVPHQLEPAVGTWQLAGDLAVSGTGFLNTALVRHAPAGAAMLFACALELAPASTGRAGLLLHATPDLDHGLQLVIDPGARTVALYELSNAWTHLVEKPFGPWVSHTMAGPLPGKVGVQVIIDGTCVEIFVNDAIALSHRFYNVRDVPIALFSSGGAATFSDISVRVEDRTP